MNSYELDFFLKCVFVHHFFGTLSDQSSGNETPKIHGKENAPFLPYYYLITL